ncbi:hypothetical protein [Actinospica robiniae]|uniref:hypothetical protein n=1 Tax=Actinospica robiniae TaxID=304901 RepID=UPI0005503700|nr:hypothetical protein [Actinospica robiniae]
MIDETVHAELDITLGEPVETVGSSSVRRRRRWWLPYAALTSVFAAVVGGACGAYWLTRHHQQALALQADDLTAVVALKAGSGLSTVFDSGYGAKDGQLKLTGPTTFYVACTAGRVVIGPFTGSCDSKSAVYGPYGTAGTVIQLSLPASPWALLARPEDQGQSRP